MSAGLARVYAGEGGNNCNETLKLTRELSLLRTSTPNSQCQDNQLQHDHDQRISRSSLFPVWIFSGSVLRQGLKRVPSLPQPFRRDPLEVPGLYSVRSVLSPLMSH